MRALRFLQLFVAILLATDTIQRRVPANVIGYGMVIINMGSIVYGFFDEVAEACGDEAEAVAHVAGDVVQTLGLSTREAEDFSETLDRVSESLTIPKKDRNRVLESLVEQYKAGGVLQD